MCELRSLINRLVISKSKLRVVESKNGSTVRYASIFAKKYGTLFCIGSGKVR